MPEPREVLDSGDVEGALTLLWWNWWQGDRGRPEADWFDVHPIEERDKDASS